MALLTGTVTGRFEDIIPGAETVTGTVSFTAEADYLLSADSTVLPAPVAVQLVGSAFTVALTATDDLTLNPVNWTYRVTFALLVKGVPVRRDPFSIKVPAGTTVNLASVTPVASYSGAPTVVGPQGIQGVIGLTGAQGIQGVQGIQGIQGFKGDAGPFSAPTPLVLTTHLDTYTTPGTYSQQSATVANSASYGYPTELGGTLLVLQRSGTTVLSQTYEPFYWTGKVFYKRWRTDAGWQPWVAHTSSRVDQTAGRAIYQWDDLNGREQMIYGDTGWRHVSADLVNGATGTLLIRRTGNQVSIKGDGIKLPSTSVSDTIYVLPAGYGVDDTHILARDNAVSGDYASFVFGGGLAFRREIHGTANNTTFRYGFHATGSTTAAWPTVLPGNASGSIPNN